MNKQFKQIKIDIKKDYYTLKKMKEGVRDPSRMKVVKKLIKKVQKMKEESIKKRMLYFFKLGKELEEEYMRRGKKYDKTLT